MEKQHGQHLLALGDIARIERCADCDVVSIHLGPTTLRLDPNACASLYATLGQALGAMTDVRRPMS
jgi:hypothetical protein